ncbi:MAG TPA: hypothetical protein VMK12_17860 [Anaeromyxobacteraceae bacterium]|nr:hypothetical protein [Anaeromyxobacteraceae bacterium]
MVRRIETEGSSPAALPTWRERFRLVSPAARRTLVILFLLAFLPAAFEVPRSIGGGWNSSIVRVLETHPAIVAIVTLVLATGALCSFEPPRSLAPSSYARQIATRLREVQADFDDAIRRRAREEEEKPPHVESFRGP